MNLERRMRTICNCRNSDQWQQKDRSFSATCSKKCGTNARRTGIENISSWPDKKPNSWPLFSKIANKLKNFIWVYFKYSGSPLYAPKLKLRTSRLMKITRCKSKTVIISRIWILPEALTFKTKNLLNSFLLRQRFRLRNKEHHIFNLCSRCPDTLCLPHLHNPIWSLNSTGIFLPLKIYLSRVITITFLFQTTPCQCQTTSARRTGPFSYTAFKLTNSFNAFARAAMENNQITASNVPHVAILITITVCGSRRLTKKKFCVLFVIWGKNLFFVRLSENPSSAFGILRKEIRMNFDLKWVRKRTSRSYNPREMA